MDRKLYLLTDCWGTASFQLCEGKAGRDGRVTFTGPFTESDRPNRNNRIYPEKVMRPEFDRLAVIAERYSLLGELDHPADSTIHLERASHRMTRLWWEKPKVGYGEAMTLPTPAGYVLEALFNEGVPIGISSRGVGSGRRGTDGVTCIEDGFKLITFDTVADPSYQDAWQQIKEAVMGDIEVGRVKVSMSIPGSVASGMKPLPPQSLGETIKRADESNANVVLKIDDVDGFIKAIASIVKR